MPLTAYGSWGNSLYVAPAAGNFSASASVERTDTVVSGAGVAVQATQYAVRGISATGEVVERLPNQFYGITELSPVTLQFDNQDGEFSYLLSEEVRNQPIRIRRYDETTGENTLLYQGVVEQAEVGSDSASISLTNIDTTLLGTPLPKQRLTAVLGDFGISNDAADSGVPATIVYGVMPRVPLSLSRSSSILQQYEYFVCEGTALVTRVYRNALATFQDAVFLTTAATFAPGVKSQYSEIEITGTTAATFSGNTLVGMWIRILSKSTFTGSITTHDTGAEGKEFQIVGVRRSGGQNPTTSTVTFIQFVEDVSLYAGATATRAVLTEYGHLYVGNRTYIRFGSPQASAATNISLTADVRRYRPPTKNLLFDTDTMSSEYESVYKINLPEHCGSWENIGLTQTTLSSSLGSNAPDGVSQYQKIGSMDAADFLSQVVKFSVVDGVPLTFSVWVFDVLLAPKVLSILLVSNGVGSTTTSTTFSYANTGLWKRISVTKTTGWGTAATFVKARFGSADAGISPNHQIFGAQLEYGATPGYYESVSSPSLGAKFENPVDVIKDILCAPYGLQQTVDLQSFEQAKTDIFFDTPTGQWLFLRAQGVLPDLTGTIRTAKDVLDDLCIFRGFRLRKVDGVWTIKADSRRSAIAATFGNEETQYRNLLAVQPIRLAEVGTIVSTVRVMFGQELFFAEGENSQVIFPYHFEKIINTVGQVKEVPLLLVRDFNTADRIMQYLAGWLPQLDTPLQVTADWDARNVQIGDLVTCIVPRLQAENLAKYSEDFGNSAAWTVTGTPTTSRPFDLDPFKRSWSATKMASSGGSSGYHQDLGFACAGERVVFKVWIRGTTTAPVTVDTQVAIRIQNVSNTIGLTKTIPATGIWKQQRLEFQFPSGAAGNAAVRVFFPGSTGQEILVWGIQATKDRDYPYVKTVATAKPAVRTYLVQQVGRSDAITTQLTLIPYVENFFAYTASKFPSRVTPTVGTDLSRIPPGVPVGLTVEIKGVDSITVGGITTSSGWVHFQFVMPINAQDVTVQIQRYSDTAWTTISTISVDTVSAGSIASAHAEGLLCGTNYIVRAIARSAAGLTSQSAILTFTT